MQQPHSTTTEKIPGTEKERVGLKIKKKPKQVGEKPQTWILLSRFRKEEKKKNI